ncbi:MAG: FIST C-terminal domain-containing protein, partial [SAR324 cluster bacterium]|nr:FIST C-terminal domain-containing protein [SAR324 cluster bacterium]
ELERFAGENPLFLFFPDVYQHQPYNFINMLNYVQSDPMVFGAGSCDDGSGRISVQFGSEGVVVNGAGGMGFKGVPDFTAGVTQSCKTIGDPMFVTDFEDDLVLTLDGTPALEVFSRVASELEFDNLENAARQLLISFPLDPEEPKFEGESSMVRHLTGIDVARQGLQVSQIIEKGTVVSFAYRSAISARDDLNAMLKRMKKEKPPSFGIYFNCAARGEALYGKSDVDIQLIHEQLGDFPLAGMFGGYEMAKVPRGLQLYTYTGVLVLIYLE